MRLLRDHKQDPDRTKNAGRGLIITGSALLIGIVLSLTVFGGWMLWELGQLLFG